ncbi:TetR family transcriptional regulator [Streptomyces sp. SLBN-118]|uniref:ScbR family autoregulator-binding transcription factor n=1 Tax=Streptomyces sp. SLBN-118 TaxID=2768454 RepID=UPI001152FDA3|nr:ScbR family autoregulator-binding transcription factor [Streptomyces sp. SLBN-118]TQK50358.1 TetR family transcriptional regulator [Streptomyces sp. SLBN-118]
MVKQERAARTREALIRSAAEVFDREGFTVASLTTICSLAGVSAGALHFHFATKAQLAGAVEEAALERLDGITAGEEQAVEPVSPLQLLVNASHRLIRGLGEDVVLRAGFELSGAAAGEHDLRRHWQQWVTRTLHNAEGEGELHRTVAPQDVVTAVVAATVGFEVLGARDSAWRSSPTVTRFWELLLPRLAVASVLAGLTAEGAPRP